MKSIPTYALYGENDATGESWLHWETITSRSRLYGFRISAHRHDQLYQILYLRGGHALVMLDGQTHKVSPPALVVVPPLTVHSFVFPQSVDGYVLTFFAQDVRNALDEIGPETEPLLRPQVLAPAEGIVEPDEIEQAVTRIIAEADRNAAGQTAALRARLSLLLIAAHRLERASLDRDESANAPSDRHARAFLSLVDQHYRDTRKIGFYASKLAITPTHLNRISRQSLGASALAVIERRILLEARRYLQFSGLSVKEIGILLGYPDPAYFSRFFSQRMGHGPQALRDRVGVQSEPFPK